MFDFNQTLRFAQIKLTPTIKKFWGYRGIFQNPPKSFLNYLLPAKSQFIVLFFYHTVGIGYRVFENVEGWGAEGEKDKEQGNDTED